MPLYEYECKKCGHRFEKIQKFSDKMVKKCPECGGQVEQMISAPAVQFKGSGWYVTDYAKKSSSPGGGGDCERESKKDDKPKADSSAKKVRSRKAPPRRVHRGKAPRKRARRKKAHRRQLFQRNSSQRFRAPSVIHAGNCTAAKTSHHGSLPPVLLQLPLKVIHNHGEQMHPRISSRRCYAFYWDRSSAETVFPH